MFNLMYECLALQTDTLYREPPRGTLLVRKLNLCPNTPLEQIDGNIKTVCRSLLSDSKTYYHYPIGIQTHLEMPGHMFFK